MLQIKWDEARGQRSLSSRHLAFPISSQLLFISRILSTNCPTYLPSYMFISFPCGRKVQWRSALLWSLLFSYWPRKGVAHSRHSVFLDLVTISKASHVFKLWVKHTNETFYHINVSTSATFKISRESLAKVGSHKPWMKMTWDTSGCMGLEAVAGSAWWPKT